MAGRFHPEHPDDLQVLVHDGGPRTSTRRPEAIWVRVTGVADAAFVGRALNHPHQLTSVRAGDEIRFVAPPNCQIPLLVTEQYLAERPDWIVHPCGGCGLTELFDPPSILIRVVFPGSPPGARTEMFTARCGMCGGAAVVELRPDA